MFTFLNSKAGHNLIVFAVFGLTALISLHHGVLIAPDTGSYATYNVIRGPGYPLWLQFFQIIGGSWWQALAVVCQVSLGLSAAYRVLCWIRQEFTLHFLALGLIALFLVSPIVWGYSNYLLSEALAYPLFLMCALSLWHARQGNPFTAVCFAIFLTLLILTRQQYMFFVVVGLTVALLLYRYFRSRRLTALWLAASLLPPITATLLERTYHYVHTGHFVSTPFAGLQFVILPLTAIPDLETATFDDKEVEHFIHKVGEKIRKDGHTEWCPVNGNFYPMSYHIFYNYLHWGTVSKIYATEQGKRNVDQSAMKNAIATDEFLMRAALSIIYNHPLNYVRSYISTWRSAFANYYLLIVTLSMCAALVGLCYQQNNQLHFVAYLACLAHLGNSSLVTFFEPPIIRYIHATEIMFFMGLILLLNEFFRSTAQTRRV